MAGTGQRLDDVVNWFWTWDIWGGLAVTKWLEMGFDFPFSLATNVEDVTSVRDRNTVSLGDIQLRSKIRILNPETNTASLGFGLLGFVNLPSGDASDFLGDEVTSGGFRLIAERSFGAHDFTAHMGLRIRDAETIVASKIELFRVNEEMLLGLGWKWIFDEVKGLSVGSEVFGSTDMETAAGSPFEWGAAVAKKILAKKLELKFGASTGLGNGYGAPDYRILLSLGYVSKASAASKEELPPLEEVSEAKIEGGRITVLKPIQFEVASAKLKEESLPTLNDVAGLLLAHPEILKVRIEGHTDSDGSDLSNFSLSERRVGGVKEYLVSQGVEAQRLEAKGWGERQPVAPNTTKEGKLQNRRVEFQIVELR